MGAWAGHRQYRLRLGTISIEVDADGGTFHDAIVSSSEAKRIARLGGLPEDMFPRWETFLRAMLLMLSIEMISRDEEIGSLFTRRRLLDELAKLSRLPLDADVPEIKPWLKGELGKIEFERLLRPAWGPTPVNSHTFPPEKFKRFWADSNAANRAAYLRVKRSLTDVGELRALARDLHHEVSARSENTREFFATKRALASDRSCIADQMLGFWTEIAGHPLTITKLLIAMTSAVYDACGFKMSVDAVKQQLHESAKRRREEA